MAMMVPAPGIARANPFSCPFCSAQAPARAAAQICKGCGRPFVLRAGARVDASVQPPPIDPSLRRIKCKAAGFIVATASIVAPEGVQHGTLDPVTGHIPMDTSGVLYSDIVSVAVYRKLDVLRLVLLCLVGPPVVLGMVGATVSVPAAAIVALPLVALLGLAFYSCLAVRRNYARIIGTMNTITVQFHSPLWRRQRFHDELLRRAGISPSAIP
jgi:hypothetical protein